MTPRHAFQIRKMQPGDEPALYRVHHESIHGLAHANYTPQQLAAWAPSGVDAEKWAARIRAIDPFVVEHEGRLVAYADLQPNGYIDHFFVSPTVARRGVGSMLMRRLHDEAAAQKLGELHAHVSLTARPFFESWGFVVETAETITRRGVQLQRFVMRKSL